jgi:hypothetical protein
MPEGEARWIADPTHRHQLRWWNGARWTEHVTDDGVAGVDWGPKGPPVPRPAPPVRPSAPLDEDVEWRGVLEESPQRQRERERRRTFGMIVGMLVLVAAAVAVVVVVVTSGGR